MAANDHFGCQNTMVGFLNGANMPENEFGKPPVKVGTRRSAQAGSKFSMPEEPRQAPGEAEEEDIRRAAREGQSGKKGRPLPSREVAMKGEDAG